MIKWLSTLLILFVTVGVAQADTSLLFENFDDIGTLPGNGWALINKSAPLGTTGWFQGNAGVFTAQAGADDAYIAANFLNADTDGDISNWLLTPELPLDGTVDVSFYTRTETGAPFPDRLEVRLSTSGASTDVGTTDTSVGDFGNLLLTINPLLYTGGYPEDWTRIAAEITGLPSGTTGRFAFRYFVPDTLVNADYIGIDTVSVAAVPEPATLVLLGFGIGTLGVLRRRFGAGN